MLTSWLGPRWTAIIREILLQSISRYYKFLPSPQREAFLSEVNAKAS